MSGLFWRPNWALHAALFVVLFPVGLIPVEIHSLLNRSLTVVALVTWLVAVISRGHRVTWTTTTFLMLGFLIWGTVTLLWASNLGSGTTMLQAYALRLILFLLLVPNEIRTKEDLNGWMSTLALIGWALILVSAGVVLFEGYVPGTRLRVLGVNENALGMLGLVTLPGVLWVAMKPSGRYRVLKIFMACAFLSLVVGIVAASGSRGSAISLLVLFLAFWFWKSTRIWGIVGLFIVLLGAIFFPLAYTTTLDRFLVVPGDTVLGGREVLWQTGWQIISEHPFRGVGIGNAPSAVISSLNAWDAQDGGGVSMHNPILTIWSETGILGIILYLGVLISGIWSFVRHYHRCRELRIQWVLPYFALVGSMFLGYMPSWFKGGGIESDFTYFLMLALLLVPSSLGSKALISAEGTDTRDSDMSASRVGASDQ
jgi:O-antigen ligase